MQIVRKSMLVLLLAAGVPMTSTAAGIVSTVATASDDIVVSSNAEATVTATGRTDLVVGMYPAKFQVATWDVTVTAGTAAWRLNRTINPPSSTSHVGYTSAGYGTAVNSADKTKVIRIYLYSNTNSTNVDGTFGWRVAPNGTSSVSGGVYLDNNAGTVELTPGVYPIGIDAAAYAF